MIEFNFPIVKTYTIRRLFLPFLVFLLTYVTYYNLFYEHYLVTKTYKESKDEEKLKLYKQNNTINYVYIGVLVTFATYFITNEIK